jgi:hypothetical protein
MLTIAYLASLIVTFNAQLNMLGSYLRTHLPAPYAALFTPHQSKAPAAEAQQGSCSTSDALRVSGPVCSLP